MGDTLYYSSLCRLCAEENPNGIPLFGDGEEESELSNLINKYLPLKVSADLKLPRTICPGCNIQLEATVQFLDLVVGGQLILRNLLKAETDSLKKEVTDEQDKIVVHIIEDGGFYTPDHAITLRVEGLEKPKRKRGRPKKSKPTTPPPVEFLKLEQPVDDGAKDNPDTDGRKRRIIAPQRFKEAVRGKELERIFREEGVIDESENESDTSTKIDPAIPAKKSTNPEQWEDEIIGHMETPEGTPMGQLVIVNKAKGRGRPKGKSRSVHQTCGVCQLEFTSLGRYMAHVALHHTQLTATDVQCDSLNMSAETVPNDDHNIANTGDDNLVNRCPENLFADDNEIGENQQSVDDTVVITSDVDPLVVTPNLLTEQTTPIVQMSEILPELSGELIQEGTEDNNKIDSLTATNCKKTDGLKFSCTQCDKLFNSKQSCEVHMKASHLKQRPFKCEQCGKSFPYQVSLKQHMLIHFPKGHRGYACDLCGKVLSHPSSVIYHKEAEHNGRRFVCSKCGRAFKHRQLLQRHQLVHSEIRPFVCKICNASFKTKANLINHQPTHTGVKKFTCGVCNQPFAHKASLTLHLRWHAGEKPYSCTVCGKCFSQNGNLAEHMRIHTGEKPYTCSICQRSFTTSSQHRLHLQRHSGEKPWQCTDCGKRFLNKETWRVHIRRHRGERPFACTECDRSFTESWALRKHQRIHSGERPYSCNICGRTFADCSNLTKHKKIHRCAEELATMPKLDTPLDDNTVSILEDVNDQTDERVVYVTYQATADDNDGTPTFHIINEDSNIKAAGECDLYSTETLEDDTTYEQSLENMPTTIFDQVTDEDGNPLHFTMQDGTQLAITSSDGGKSLQVTTHDGQTIPVQLSDKMDDDDDNVLKEELILASEIVGDENSSEELMQPIRVLGPGGQSVRFLATLDDNNLSYFTFA